MIRTNHIMLRELLCEKSSLSVMRVMSLVCVFTSVAVAFVCIYTDKNLVDCSILVSAFLVPAFGGKMLQRRFENSPNKPQQ